MVDELTFRLNLTGVLGSQIEFFSSELRQDFRTMKNYEGSFFRAVVQDVV